jgi:hypothetical protein
LPRHLAGTPVWWRRTCRARGVRAANHLYSSRQGRHRHRHLRSGGVPDQLLGVQLRGDVRQFNWIGRMANNSAVLLPHRGWKIEDAFTHQLIVAAPGSSSRLN